jgi:hypothetical protein
MDTLFLQICPARSVSLAPRLPKLMYPSRTRDLLSVPRSSNGRSAVSLQRAASFAPLITRDTV